GIIRRQTLEMFISKIESVAIDQGFFGRVFDYGTVIVRGTGGFEERFEAIARPVEFRNWVQRMQRAVPHGTSAAM
ncbi:MAG TPA: PH domain-containing protein, partial [Chthoniobacterales bacterium]|nr:PH domain-containing protein [Chthoniobacterales bacterium]